MSARYVNSKDGGFRDPPNCPQSSSERVPVFTRLETDHNQRVSVLPGCGAGRDRQAERDGFRQTGSDRQAGGSKFHFISHLRLNQRTHAGLRQSHLDKKYKK